MSCRWLPHSWTQWTIVDDGNLQRVGEPTSIVGRYILQRRKCISCGLTQQRAMRTMFI